MGILQDGEYNFNTCLLVCRPPVDFNFIMHLINFSVSRTRAFRTRNRYVSKEKKTFYNFIAITFSQTIV